MLTRQRQHNRILQLSFINDDGPEAELLINRLEASEALSRDFCYTLELLSNDADIALKSVMGKLLCAALTRGDGTQRYFTGYVDRFSFIRSDGGIAFYEARLVPWLAFLKSGKNNRVFHRLSLEGLSAELFSGCRLHAQWDCRLRQEDPIRTAMFQFDESDSNMLHRRWEEAGWHYHYEHDARGHRLMLSDDSTYALSIDGDQEVPFQHHGGAVEEDGITHWSAARQFQPASVALTSYDFKTARAQHVDVPTLNKQGAVPPVEYYEYTGAYGFSNRDDGDRQSRLRMEEFEAAAKVFEGAGNCRYLQPGRAFRMTGHFSERRSRATGSNGLEEDQTFLVVSVDHSATNNYLHHTDAPPCYTNRVTCIRRRIPWRPGRGHHSQATILNGMQTATVVGPSTENHHVDQYGRVKVQFHWDRLGHDDAGSSAWIRVASSWAGAAQGFIAVPRIGQLVIVQWLGGHPDRPVITGAVVNQLNMPPWALPSQAALAGIRSRELTPRQGNTAGGRSGHLLFDDTHEAIQTQVRSDAFDSQLSLGHITRIEQREGRRDTRGQGFELRSDAHGVIRAAQGLLLTSEARPKAHGHVTGLGETVARLTQARSTVDSLSRLAQEHQAQDKDGDQQQVAAALQAQNDAIQGSSEDGRPAELSEPHLLLASPSGIEASSGASTHLASAEHAAVTAGSHVSLAAGKSFFASAAEKISLLAYRMGLKLIAASGRVQIQAQNDSMEILAQKVVDIISTRDWINLRAKKGIRLNGGGSELVIAEGITGFTKGVHHIHAEDHQTFGPQEKPAEFPGARLCSTRNNGAAQAGDASVPLS